ncbi:ribosome small subunit-dependent GTPase A [Gorillibacterium sp. sgz5001074]|uniref:ribosome small subunit-dependent GTPase A n=1 Tax=Gorillibacterium sp. sgz5001074 TaxID=3446695 RepID=UPI003F6811EA
MPEGLIVKALSGYYYVLPDEPVLADEVGGFAGLVQCRARGIFKKRNISPLVGDRVEFERSENGEGTVTEICPRTSELIRPPVSNVEQAVLVFSMDEPALNLQLLDKFLVHIEYSGLEPVICFSKQDLIRNPEEGEKGAGADSESVYRLYETIGYKVLITSAKEGEGVEQVREVLKDRISVFSGQSGVGKSTLLNALMPHLVLETGEISMRLGRGRHTTRHVELIPLPEGGWVADTPGFSQLDFMEMEPEELGSTFREFVPLSEECRFRGCLHHKEPGCRVREAVAEGSVAATRYEHYLLFLEEMKDRKRRY